MKPGNCQCFVCKVCYHDHGKITHAWINPYPCASNKGYSTGDFQDWCTLQLDHPGQCLYKSEVMDASSSGQS